MGKVGQGINLGVSNPEPTSLGLFFQNVTLHLGLADKWARWDGKENALQLPFSHLQLSSPAANALSGEQVLSIFFLPFFSMS